MCFTVRKHDLIILDIRLQSIACSDICVHFLFIGKEYFMPVTASGYKGTNGHSVDCIRNKFFAFSCPHNRFTLFSDQNLKIGREQYSIFVSDSGGHMLNDLQNLCPGELKDDQGVIKRQDSVKIINCDGALVQVCTQPPLVDKGEISSSRINGMNRRPDWPTRMMTRNLPEDRAKRYLLLLR